MKKINQIVDYSVVKIVYSETEDKVTTERTHLPITRVSGRDRLSNKVRELFGIARQMGFEHRLTAIRPNDSKSRLRGPSQY